MNEKHYSSITLMSRILMVSSMATLTVGPYLSPNTLISGPVMCTTDCFSESGVAALMASDRPSAEVSFISGAPVSNPSRNTGSRQVIPYKCHNNNVNLP